MESTIKQMSRQPLINFNTTDWGGIRKTQHAGETGTAHWRTLQWGDLRVRMVEYSPGYKADHWCTKGHILFCLEGELFTELKSGETFLLKKGMSYQVSDDVSSHRSYTHTGATLFIVDGGFLQGEKNTMRGIWM
jgi:hypothetical protein